MEEQNNSDPEIIPSVSDWSKLPRHSLPVFVQEKRKNGIQYAFSLLTPAFSPGQMDQLPIVAVATLSLLLELDKTGVGADTVQNAQPLMSIFSIILNACRITFRSASVFFLHAPQPLVNLITNDWPIIKEFTEKLVVPKNPGETQPDSLHKEIGHAVARRDVVLLDQLWLRAQKLPTYFPTAKDGSDSGYKFGYLTPSTYDYFILAFMSLKHQPRAVAVWNHLVNSGLTPSLTTWEALLNGCKSCRDPKALEQIWAMLIASGETPDITCWTTRISGLIHCYKADAGIRALDEMSRLWLAAVKKKYPNFSKEDIPKTFNDVTGAVRPTIATVNAAVSGLIKMQRPVEANRVLAWARQWGIAPDVQTYNVLLGSMVRAGRKDKAPELLDSMEGQGVQVDVTTFVAVLEQTFAEINKFTPEEQIEAINNTFATMEKANVVPNLYFYGKMIHLLLRWVPTDTRPVAEVMARLARQNLTPSTYIYTILIEYYFAQRPPNFQAIDNLIERTHLTIGAVDHIFWDRLIENYARVGDTMSAISYLRKVQKSKQFTSWNTMGTLLVALIENNELDVAQELVENLIADTGGPPGINERGAEGQHRFWEIAREYGFV